MPPPRRGVASAEFDMRALIEQAAHIEDLRNLRRSDASARPSAPVRAHEGPDTSDGHDWEGFTGGCTRMGCPPNCARPGSVSLLRRNLTNLSQDDRLNLIYEEVMRLRDATLNQLPANHAGELEAALETAHQEIARLQAQNARMREELYTQQQSFQANAHSPSRQPIYVVAVTQERDPLNIGSTESCLRLMRELEQMPMDNETVLDPESICGYLREIVRLRRGTDPLHDYLSHHGSLSEAIEHANMDNERDMLEVWRMDAPAALATGHLSYRDPKLVARRRPRDGFEHWHVFDKNEAKRFERVHNIGAQNQEVRDEEEI